MRMRPRVRLFLRRFGRRLVGLASILTACVLVATGHFDQVDFHRPRASSIAGLLLLGTVVVWSLVAALRFTPPSARAQRASRLLRLIPIFVDLQAGLALVVGAQGLVALTGGLRSPLFPLVVLVVAFSASFQTRWAAVSVAVCAVIHEVASGLRGAEPTIVLFHTAFLTMAGVAHALFLRGLLARMRGEHRQRLASEVERLREEARDFRLIAAALGAESRAPRSRAEEERRLADGAVETIHASMYYTLELLKKSLELQTCVLLWLDDSGEHLKIKELVTDSDSVIETALASDSGALGAIVRDRLLLNLSAPKPSHVAYYGGAEEVGAFLGVPVIEDGHLRGVLCADRCVAKPPNSPNPFDERDEALLKGAAQQILRALRNERVFIAVERSKYEHERLYHASAMLGRALTLDQVMATAFDAAYEIVEFDFASVALFDRERRRHRVLGARVAPGAEGIVDVRTLEGLEFGDNAGLLSMVVKNKHYLPAGGELRDASATIYTRKVKLRGLDSLLVLPLVCADDAIGTFTVGSRRRHAFGADKRDMLGVIANQVAVSLENAKMYKQMETMATTDGLTGLYNHRTFQERLTDMMGRAERHGMKLALILTDVDHFKRVNDTYGHPMGDQVLRRVAQVLAESVRKIDLVARYGGEEFAVVLEGTDASGAQNLAERIRADVARNGFSYDAGSFSVNLSLGIASYPDDAREKQVLIERADQALYFAKHNGRNRSVTYGQFLAERALRCPAKAS